MKRNLKSFMVLFVFIVFSTTIFAMDIGIKGGLNLSKLKILDIDCEDYDCEEDVVETRNQNGFQVGMFFTFDISKNIQLQPEVYYVKKGAKQFESYSSDWMSVNTELKWKLNYIEIPVLLKFNMPTKGNIKPGFFAGPYFAHNLNASLWIKETGEIYGEEYDEEAEQDIRTSIESFDYGLVAGFCIDVKIGSVKLTGEARYSYGLANISKYGGIVNNRTFVFMLGVGF